MERTSKYFVASFLLLASAVASAPVLAGQVPTDLTQWATDTENRAIELDELIQGCPYRDCIRSIDDPTFTSVDEADEWLNGRAPVAVVRVGQDTRAYPLQILVYHEIVNDHVGGMPVAVTYCPLCNTTIAFDRRHDEQVLDFGVSGFLRHSDLVMYDRQSETLWQQATGEGIVGRRSGERLTPIAAPVMSWKDFKETAPEGSVLSRETGSGRDYSRMAYSGYDSKPGPIARFFKGKVDERMGPMERVVAMGVERDGVAVPFAALSERRAITTEVDGAEVVVLWTPGTASILDGDTMEESKDIGAAGVFSTDVAGRRLRFRPADDDRFTDRETGSTWTIAGVAVDGELTGTRLTPVPYTNAFWFAWGTFRPDTRIVRK